MLVAAGESQSASGLKTDCRRSTLISLIFGLDNGEYLTLLPSLVDEWLSSHQREIVHDEIAADIAALVADSEDRNRNGAAGDGEIYAQPYALA